MIDLPIVGEGKTTKVYRDGERAIKLYVSGPADEAEREAAKQRAALEAGLPVPRVYGVCRRPEGTALIMDCVQGQPLFRAEMTTQEAEAALARLVALQREMHALEGKGLPAMADVLKWKIGRVEALAPEERGALAARVDELSGGERALCHGDFHPLNVLDDGEKLWIIDWVDATCGPPLADACRSYFLLEQSQASALLAKRYLQMYCEASGAKEEDVLAWMPILAAVRLLEGFSSEVRAELLGRVRAYGNRMN